MRFLENKRYCQYLIFLLMLTLGGCKTPGRLLPVNMPVAEAGAQPVSIRVVSARTTLSLGFEKAVSLNGKQTLPPGSYALQLRDAHLPRIQYHLFSKTFRFTEEAQARAYVTEWTGKGFSPKIVTFGKCFTSPDGASIDNRSLWISLARANSQVEAESLKKRLETQGVWAWVQMEMVQPGSGTVEFINTAHQSVARVATPVSIRSGGLVHVDDADAGYLKKQAKDRTYGGLLEIRVAPGGGMDGITRVCVDDYLAGVLPGEMPARWPEEALKAQAVAARSDVLTALSGKHLLEGFDFCGTEHCRVYLGEGGRCPASDQAVRATQGLVLIADGRLVPAVFSANCGGWTEDNDTVWSSPPQAALRGVPDVKRATKRVQEYGITQWLTSPPPAFCSDSDNFRWQRRFTADELDTLVNKRYAVGRVRSIELGERGCSGRLKSVKIIGSKGTQVVNKELAIRQVFGGLNSALFGVKMEGPAGQPSAFVFSGAGRGHGVGLCQDGARGRAMAGQNYQTILRAYYAAASIQRVE